MFAPFRSLLYAILLLILAPLGLAGPPDFDIGGSPVIAHAYSVPEPAMLAVVSVLVILLARQRRG